MRGAIPFRLKRPPDGPIEDWTPDDFKVAAIGTGGNSAGYAELLIAGDDPEAIAKLAAARWQDYSQHFYEAYLGRFELLRESALALAHPLKIAEPSGEPVADPLTEPHWTIPMALAWIAEPGNVGAVSKLSGHRLELWQLPKEPRPQRDDDGVIYVRRLAGWDALKKKLEGSVFEAWGVPFAENKRASIPAHEWRDLDLIQEKHSLVVRINGSPPSGYSDVVFRSSDVCAAWPVDKKAAAKKRPRDGDQELTKRLMSVVSYARDRWGAAVKRPPFRRMAKHIKEQHNDQGFSQEALRQILSGRYVAMNRLGLKGIDG